MILWYHMLCIKTDCRNTPNYRYTSETQSTSKEYINSRYISSIDVSNFKLDL